MKLETINKLCCPFDKDDLRLTIITTDVDRRHILEGILHCDSCSRIYPIIRGIPIMNPDEYREFELEAPVMKRWERYLEGKEFKDFRLRDGDVKKLT